MKAFRSHEALPAKEGELGLGLAWEPGNEATSEARPAIPLADNITLGIQKGIVL